jgi:hypothetical protein
MDVILSSLKPEQLLVRAYLNGNGNTGPAAVRKKMQNNYPKMVKFVAIALKCLDACLHLPNDLSAGVHRHCRLLAAKLDEDGSLVVADGHVVRALERGDGPDPLEAVVEGVLQPVRVGVPNADGAVLAAGQDDGQLRVEADRRDVLKRDEATILRVVLTNGKNQSEFFLSD